MSENTPFGFGKFVPGFDFLQNLAKGASQSMQQMPSLSNWVAPTLNVEELDKRIAELKAVQFWLDQNGKALGATIQALEVQKMTLATLQGMNFRMGELADALTLKPGAGGAGAKAPEKAADKPADTAAAAKASAKPGAKPAPKAAKTAPAQGAAAGAPIDPLQWWGALTQQFQEIAANAMKDAASPAAAPQSAPASAATPRRAAGKKSTARKASPRKSRTPS